jgi:hypothetical protein
MLWPAETQHARGLYECGGARPKDLGTLDGSRGGLILPRRVKATPARETRTAVVAQLARLPALVVSESRDANVVAASASTGLARVSPEALFMPVGIAAAALVACQLIAGCGSSGSGGQIGQPPAGSTASCQGLVEFDLPVDNPNPHGATPRQALNAFLARGTVNGSAPPILSPVKAGYPASGWRQVKASSGKAVFASGGDELDFTRDGDGSWVITSGTRNC